MCDRPTNFSTEESSRGTQSLYLTPSPLRGRPGGGATRRFRPLPTTRHELRTWQPSYTANGAHSQKWALSSSMYSTVLYLVYLNRPGHRRYPTYDTARTLKVTDEKYYVHVRMSVRLQTRAATDRASFPILISYVNSVNVHNNFPCK